VRCRWAQVPECSNERKEGKKDGIPWRSRWGPRKMGSHRSTPEGRVLYSPWACQPRARVVLIWLRYSMLPASVLCPSLPISTRRPRCLTVCHYMQQPSSFTVSLPLTPLQTTSAALCVHLTSPQAHVLRQSERLEAQAAELRTQVTAARVEVKV
jgi:hypothetical protein